MGISSPGTDIYLCQKSETMKTGIFFGSTLGTTENIAGQIATALRISPDDIHNVADTDPSAVQGYDCLLLGSSTWGAGDLQDDWYDFIGKLKNENLSGKLVGLFGCGDSGSYPDTFCDAMGHLYNVLSAHAIPQAIRSTVPRRCATASSSGWPSTRPTRTTVLRSASQPGWKP